MKKKFSPALCVVFFISFYFVLVKNSQAFCQTRIAEAVGEGTVNNVNIWQVCNLNGGSYCGERTCQCVNGYKCDEDDPGYRGHNRNNGCQMRTETGQFYWDGYSDVWISRNGSEGVIRSAGGDGRVLCTFSAQLSRCLNDWETTSTSDDVGTKVDDVATYVINVGTANAFSIPNLRYDVDGYGGSPGSCEAVAYRAPIQLNHGSPLGPPIGSSLGLVRGWNTLTVNRSDACGVNFSSTEIYITSAGSCNPPPPKTCSISIDKTSINANQSVTMTYSGRGQYPPGEYVRAFIEKDPDLSVINPNPGTDNQYTPPGGVTQHYYLLDEVLSTNAQNVSGSKSISNLPPGNYRLHCDVPGRSESLEMCSGNPYCSVNGGWLDCGGWLSCSPDDWVSLTVNAPPSSYSCSLTPPTTSTTAPFSVSATQNYTWWLPITSSTFNWGDGTGDDSSGNLEHTYAAGSCSPVNGGCIVKATPYYAGIIPGTQVTCGPVTITPPTSASCSVTPTSGPVGTIVTTTHNYTGPYTPVRWFFDWKDGYSGSNYYNPVQTHTYTDPANYIVSVCAIDSSGQQIPGSCATCPAITIAPSPPPGGITITGQAFNDADGSGCKDVGESSLNFNSGIGTVQLNPGAIPTSFTNGTFSFSSLTTGSYTLSLTTAPTNMVYSGFQIGSGPCNKTSPPSNLNLGSISGNTTVSIGFTNNVSWLNAFDGDVYANALPQIFVPPADVVGAVDNWLISGTTPSSIGTAQSTGIIKTYLSSPPNRTSTKNWEVNNYPGIVYSDTFGFSGLGNSLPNLTGTLTAGSAYNLSGPVTLTGSYNIGGVGVATVYISGDVTINGDFKNVAQANLKKQGLLLIVNGKVNIIPGSTPSQPNQIDAVIVGNNQINAVESGTDSKLTVNGGLYALTSPSGILTLPRKLTDNTKIAAITVNFMPVYLTNQNQNFVKPVMVSWKEIPPTD